MERKSAFAKRTDTIFHQMAGHFPLLLHSLLETFCLFPKIGKWLVGNELDNSESCMVDSTTIPWFGIVEACFPALIRRWGERWDRFFARN